MTHLSLFVAENEIYEYFCFLDVRLDCRQLRLLLLFSTLNGFPVKGIHWAWTHLFRYLDINLRLDKSVSWYLDILILQFNKPQLRILQKCHHVYLAQKCC